MGLFNKRQLNILKSFNWLFSAYIYRFLLGFFTLAVVTRYLGPEKYGVYTYALSAYTILESFFFIINHEVLKKEFILSSLEEVIIKTVLIFQSAFSVVLFIVAQVLLWKFDFEVGDRRELLTTFLFCLFVRPLDVFTHLFSSVEKNELVAKSEIYSVTLFNISRLVIVFLKEALSIFVWAFFFQKMLKAFINLRFYIKEFTGFKYNVKFDKTILLKMLKSSFPLFMAASASIIFTRIDQIMLGKFLTSKDVGIYSVVVKLSETWVFIAVIFTQSIFPRLVEAFGEGENVFYIKIQKSLTLLLYVSLIIIIGTLLFGDILVGMIFSSKYLASVPILKIHIFYLIFVFWTQITNQYDILKGLSILTMWKTLIASIANIIMNYFFIKEYGVVGASYATILSYILLAFILNGFFKETRPLFFMQLKSVLFWKHKWVYKD